MKNKTNIDLKALFLGDRGENIEFYKNTLSKLMDDHVGWRKNYMPQDPPAVSVDDMQATEYKETLLKTVEVLNELSQKMRQESVPCCTAGRYWGHMHAQTLMAAELAYMFSMLWNSNNCSYDSSPATSLMEGEVGQQLCIMMGWKEGWGHLSAGGTIANIEALWVMRNLKSLPLAVKKICPELVKDKDEWALLNMSVDDTVALMNKTGHKLDEVKAHTARRGGDFAKLGKLIVPQTKHYSWVKGADLIGIGSEGIVECPVTNTYVLDMNAMEKIIRDLVANKIPIMGVVGVVGTTEEGQIDPIGDIIALREKLRKEGIDFYVHVDAAYGGYGRTAILDEENELIPFEKIQDIYKQYKVFNGDINWPTKDVYDAFASIRFADSATIDAHKLGYIPYTAGGIAFRVRDVRNAISYFADYVFEKGTEYPVLLGAFTVEGSKAGATAASAWAAHRVLPLNISGYGKLICATVEGIRHFRDFINERSYTIGKHKVTFKILTEPSFNIVDYVIKEDGIHDLQYTNKINRLFYAYASAEKGGIYDNGFIVSHTDLATSEYGNSPFNFVESLGFDWGEWEHTERISVLRSCCMSPYMRDAETFEKVATPIDKVIAMKLAQVFAELDAKS